MTASRQEFVGARLKVARAERHLRELMHTVMVFLKTDFAVVHAEEDVDTGTYSIKIDATAPYPPEIPAIIGDAVHNLRTALDHIVTQFTDPKSDWISLPTAKGRENVEALAVVASNFRVARTLFWVAALSFGSLGIVWSVQSHGYSLVTQILVSLACAVIAAVGLVWGLREVRGRLEAEQLPKPIQNKPDGRNSPQISAERDVHIGHVGDVINNPPDSSTRVTRTAFSQTQSVNALPSSMGGKAILKLDNLATLKRHASFSLNHVTMLLDVVPIPARSQSSPSVIVQDAQFYAYSTSDEFVFDTGKNRRHEISVSGRTFIVTLQAVRKLDIPNFAVPFEWEFGISEK